MYLHTRMLLLPTRHRFYSFLWDINSSVVFNDPPSARQLMWTPVTSCVCHAGRPSLDFTLRETADRNTILCFIHYPQHSGPALFKRHTCMLRSLSLGLTIYILFVIVCHPVTEHRWDDRTRSNHLQVHCFTRSKHFNRPSNCFLFQLVTLCFINLI